MPSPPSPGALPAVNPEPIPPRSNKTRLNLLNPMALLARRRTSQAIPQTITPVPVQGPSLKPPTPSFDPSIRGTRVHDFDSAPRPRRNVSYNDIQHAVSGHKESTSRSPDVGSSELGSSPGDDQWGLWSGVLHTPVFTEDFDEEQYPAAGPHVRKASDFSDLVAPRPYYSSQPQSQSNTAIAVTQNHPAIPEKSSRRSSRNAVLADEPPPVPPKSPRIPHDTRGSPPAETKKISINAADASKTSPSSVKTRSRNVSGASTKEFLMNGAKPRHSKSTSSRFSFDIIGAAKQEKLLEDRHRQKALEQQASSPTVGLDEDARSEEFDYDDMIDDDGGLEERIPGVNADAEDDDEYTNLEEMPRVKDRTDENDATTGLKVLTSIGAIDLARAGESGASIIGTTKQDSISPEDVKASGQTVTTMVSPVSPLSAEYTVVQSNAGAIIPALATDLDQQASSYTSSDQHKTEQAGLHIGASLGHGHDGHASEYPDGYGSHKDAQTINADDDDMYFDDGMIDVGEDQGETGTFDESIFDNDDTDRYGRPLRSLSSLPTLYSPPFIRAVEDSQERSALPPKTSDRNSNEPIRLSLASNKSVTFETSGSLHQTRLDEDSPLLNTQMSLTHDTLNAYQSALAAAAFEAAAKGRFSREQSSLDFGMNHDDQDSPKATSQSIDADNDADDFDYDDAMADDDIIAEANAEALANDSDGFYGQEFGFYSAQKIGTADAMFANGGYFGLKGDGLIRTKSGRMVREPSLTPITERSEYSARNSMMSVPQSVHAYAQSPNLAQLAGTMGDYDDENMSLSALLKLRRGAWGGSQASIRSSNGDGSPLDAVAEEEFPVERATLPSSTLSNNLRRNSAISTGNHSESPVSAPASPTFTLAKSASPLTIGLPPPPSQMINSLKDRPLSPRFAGAVGMVSSDNGERETAFGKQGRSHRHTGSADSISYLEEDDPIAGKRWVLERRRTAETGEIEVLNRQVISGGRI